MYAIVCQGLEGQIVGDTNDDDTVPVGWYLAGYQPEANDGWGQADWAESIDDALLFPDAHAAYIEWARSPDNRPLRPDGLPNRPLTAFSVEAVPVDGLLSEMNLP